MEYPGQLPEGAILQGLWRVREPLRSSGTTDQYLAARVDTGQAVVVALPRPTLGPERQGALRDAFLSEARRLAALEHPNLLRVWMTLEAFSLQPLVGDARQIGCPVMICELLEGRPLAEELSRQPQQPAARALGWLAGALEGLGALAESGYEGHGAIKARSLFVVDPEGAKERAVWVELGELWRAQEGEGAPAGGADLRALALLTLKAWTGDDLKEQAKAEKRPLEELARRAVARRASEERLDAATRAGMEVALLGALEGRWEDAGALLEALAPLLPQEEVSAAASPGAGRWALALVLLGLGAIAALWGSPRITGWGAGCAGGLPAGAAKACPPLGRMPDGACPPEGMVFVPGGRFRVGLAGGEASELPERSADVVDFLLDRREVTVGEWGRCVEVRACEPPALEGDPALSWGKAGRQEHPISGISWEQAARYCAHQGKRLPTALEWERAARGGDGRRYPWGAQPPSCALAVTWTPTQGPGCGQGEAAPVGSREAGASPYGALDMAGNVWEWVDAPRRGADGVVWGHEKRGGSWAEPLIEPPERADREWWQIQLRASFWRVSPPETGYHNTGLRCARDAQARR